jgi:hypothetical protein
MQTLLASSNTLYPSQYKRSLAQRTVTLSFRKLASLAAPSQALNTIPRSSCPLWVAKNTRILRPTEIKLCEGAREDQISWLDMLAWLFGNVQSLRYLRDAEYDPTSLFGI